MTHVNLTKSILVAILIVSQYGGLAQITKQWESRYTETGYSDDSAEDVITDANENVFVLGHSGGDALLIKYDKAGKLIWSFQAGRGVFMESLYDPMRDFKMDAAGNIYILLFGYKINEYYATKINIIKISPDGKELWQQLLPAGEGKIALAMHPDGSAYAFYSTAYNQTALSKFTSSGTVSWTKNFNTTDKQYVQAVSIVNNNIVAWHYTNYQLYDRKSYLHQIDPDGNVIWENEFAYQLESGSAGTHITQVQHYSNELIVAYYIDTSSESFSLIVRYNLETGALISSFRIQMDPTFRSDHPLAGMFVGDDAQIYVMGEVEFIVRKYSLDGVFQTAYRLSSDYLTDYEALDAVFHKENSVADFLLKVKKFNAGVSYAIISFKPNGTWQILANLSLAKPEFKPTALAVSVNNVYAVGDFNNALYQNDILVTKFTKSNTLVWNAFFDPVNSLPNLPTCITGDSHGNTYVGGMLLSEPGKSVFGIIKYDPAGKQLWVKKIAPDNLMGNYWDGHTKVLAIAANDEGEVVVTGGVRLTYSSQINRNPIEMYTLKLDLNGNTMWMSKTSGTLDDFVPGFQINFDNDKNIYVLGANGNPEIDSRAKMVLVKYDPQGNSIWENRFSLFNGYQGVEGPTSETPKMKVVNNDVYVFNKGYVTENNWDYIYSMELRKFDASGNETLVYQDQDVCPTCNLQLSPRDLCVDNSGNIYLLYNQHLSSGWGYGNMHTKLLALTPTGTKRWEKDWEHIDKETYPYDGTLILNASNELYTFTSSQTEFSYTKISNDGNIIWNKKEELRGYDVNFGRPVFAFMKADNNPVFLSTNRNEENSNYYFIEERNKDTGDTAVSETFNESYDRFGGASSESPGQQLTGFFKSKSSDSFFITGVLEDKGRGAETFVTISYSFGNNDNGDGEPDDDDDDDDGSGDGEPGGDDNEDNGNGDGDGDDDDGEPGEDDNEGNDNGDGEPDDDEDEVTAVEPNDVHNIFVIPTVTRGTFRLEGIHPDAKSIILTDSFGRLVHSLNPRDEFFDISSAPSGLYFVKIQQDNKSYVAKVIKE